MAKGSQAPRYEGATIGLLVGFSIKAACHVSLLGNTLALSFQKLALMSQGYMFIANRRRHSRYGPASKAGSKEAVMQDQTEFDNKYFRYLL